MSDTVEPSAWAPCVAVPARNEVERIPALLRSLADQSWLDGAPGRRLPVYLVLNNTTDNSLEAALQCAADLPQLDLNLVSVVFSPAQAHVGSARRRAMNLALAGLKDPAHGVLLTTDADARPDRRWIDASLAAIAAGADAVGGRIVGDAAEEALLGPAVLRRARDQLRYARLCDQLASVMDPTPHDPWPRHQDHTGASLAVRARAYRAVGGLPALPFREDLGLVRRLRAANFKLAHPLSVQVEVSARLHGRAPGGMAECLRGWMRAEAEQRPHLVEAPEDVRTRLQGRAALRRSPDALVGERLELWAADDPDVVGVVPILDAIAQMEALIAMEAAQDAC